MKGVKREIQPKIAKFLYVCVVLFCTAFVLYVETPTKVEKLKLT